MGNMEMVRSIIDQSTTNNGILQSYNLVSNSHIFFNQVLHWLYSKKHIIYEWYYNTADVILIIYHHIKNNHSNNGLIQSFDARLRRNDLRWPLRPAKNPARFGSEIWG
jgi:hypothetical protein